MISAFMMIHRTVPPWYLPSNEAFSFISLNGHTGEVLEGEQAVAPPSITGDLKTFMDWVDEIRTVDVLANADTPADAKEARKNGANGIGGYPRCCH